MNPETRKILLVALNYVFPVAPNLGSANKIAFMQELEKVGLGDTNVNATNDGNGEALLFTCSSHGVELHLRVGKLANLPMGQFLLQSMQPPVFELVQKQFSAALKAYSATWPRAGVPVIRSDATMTAVYEATEEHAFAEIWVKWLKKDLGELGPLQRPVLGGGLRFVMPSRPDQPGEPVVELKIESFIPDATKIYVETQFVWQQPSGSGEAIDPAARIHQLEQYIAKNAVSFFTGGTK